MAVCWVILRGQQIFTVIQAVHSLLYIVAKCHFFSVVTWKDIIKYLQKCEGCSHFCEILYIYIHTYIHTVYTVYIRGGTVHRCHGSVRTSVRGSRFDTISVQHEKKRNLLCSVSFHLFWTDSSANKNRIHLDVKTLHIITCYIYKIRFVFTNKSRPLYSDY